MSFFETLAAFHANCHIGNCRLNIAVQCTLNDLRNAAQSRMCCYWTEYRFEHSTTLCKARFLRIAVLSADCSTW